VQLVEIDIVGLQPLQRGVDRIQDVLEAHALVPGPAPGAADALGGDDVVVALADQPIADDFLGAAHRVAAAAERIDVGAVEEVDPALGGGVHDRTADVLLTLQTEGHGAEAEAGNGEAGAAELGSLHTV